jgi:hypothetical protein
MYAIDLTWALLCDPALSTKYAHFVFTFLLKRVCQFEEARIHFEFFDWEEDFRCQSARASAIAKVTSLSNSLWCRRFNQMAQE